MTQAILLDLDDTLYLESQFVFGGYKAVAQFLFPKLGVDLYSALVEEFKQGGSAGVFEKVLRKDIPDLTEEDVRTLVEVYRSHTPTLTFFPDVSDFLKVAHSRVAIGLVTDGYASVQRRKVQALGIERYVDAAVYNDDFGREFWKPHSRGFEECLRRIGVKPADALAIGDNPHKDFSTPRAMGMRTVRVRRPGTLYWTTDLENGIDADQQVSDLREMIPQLERMAAPLRISS